MKPLAAVLTPLAAGALLAMVPSATVLAPRTAGACSLAGNDDHHLDPAHAGDTTPPSLATATADLAWHGDDGDSGGCGSTVSSCGSYGLLTVTVAATDDAAPADELGYQLRVAAGVPPSGLDLPAQNVRAFSGELLVYFDYSSPGFDFDLEIRAVDLNGNLGPPSVLSLSHLPGE